MKVFHTLLFLFLVGLGTTAYCLPDSLGLKEQNGETFIMHRVDKGETLFSIGQRYDVAVDQLRSTNPQTEDQLVVGEIIMIPYEGKEEDSAKPEAWERHTVEKGQTLFSISKQYDASVEQIKEWNNLSGNNIEVGQKLKVGKATERRNSSDTTGDTRKEPDSSSDEQKPESEKSTVKADTVTMRNSSGDQVGTTKITPKGDGLVTKEQKGKATWLENSNINAQKSLALHRSAPAGTIIKVKNLMNDKVIFVRTVGQLNTKRRENTLITISRKAAEELQVENDYFRAKLQYTIKQANN
jgi:LysM repeat protein